MSTKREHPAKKYKSPSYPNVIDDLRSLNLSQAISDIVIQSKGTTLHAHKTILCAGSLRLRKVITKGKSTSSLKMEDLEEETVSRLLLFLYTDSLGEIKWEDATKLYHAAVAYQIERLKIKCSCFFLENLDATTASHLLQLAHKYRDARLKLLVEDFSSLHDKDITLSEDWQKIDEIDSSKRVETRLSKRLRLEKGYESTENIDIS
ncbi:unnamed protein product [Larinioides sclopetarius]|uniref:BTB domain-containing protein n=1 Tax=Larinioides sclopetarius TaxID=280406 RepID=A0AAV2B406_9ARAC